METQFKRKSKLKGATYASIIKDEVEYAYGKYLEAAKEYEIGKISLKEFVRGYRETSLYLFGIQVGLENFGPIELVKYISNIINNDMPKIYKRAESKRKKRMLLKYKP